jgi:hypothetical protein
MTTVEEAFTEVFHGLLDQADGSSGVELGTAMEHLRGRGFDRPTISTLMKAQILDGHVQLTPDRRLVRTP